jgi:outer membrane protein OmpA-like peptidoglycan-associated protein
MAAPACTVSAGAAGSAKSGQMAGESSLSAGEPSRQPSTGADEHAAEPAIALREGRLDYRGVINFEYDEAALRDDEETSETLDEFRRFLEDHPEVSLEIEGHTDSRGADEYNLDLSARRASALRDWLVTNGIDESRLTAVGKGESEPQMSEPELCREAEPEDTSSCEHAWATNRRVVFEVTGGEETIEPPPPPPAPSAATPEADEPVRADELDCPWLVGGHLNGLGPNSLVMVAGAAQPGLCWLEVSLGIGFGAGRYSASAAGLEARGQYSRFAVPLRGRVWFMEQGHSFVGDLALGATHYRMQAASADGTNGYLDYTRNSTPFLSALALGYGWRPEGPQPGYRFTAMLGGVLHPTRMKDSSFDTDGDFSAAVAGQLSTALDERTQDFTDPSLFAEVSLGLLF